MKGGDNMKHVLTGIALGIFFAVLTAIQARADALANIGTAVARGFGG